MCEVMKRCSHCGEIKDECEFNKNRSTKDGLSHWCRECSKKYRYINHERFLVSERRSWEAHKDKRREYYKQQYQKHKASISKRSSERQHGRVMFLHTLKTPCVKCGESKPQVIDFHHVNPATKSFGLSTYNRRHSENELMEEIEKCVCLCSNCHRDFHFIYGKNPKSPIEALGEYLGDVSLLERFYEGVM